ncbi:Hypothetical protein NocV09_06100020 [Nannochloropsis oceanica]
MLHLSTLWKWTVPMSKQAQVLVSEAAWESERAQTEMRCTTRISYYIQSHNKLVSYHTNRTGYSTSLLDTHRQRRHMLHLSTLWKWTVPMSKQAQVVLEMELAMLMKN